MVLRSNQVSCVPDGTEDSGVAGPKVRVRYICSLGEVKGSNNNCIAVICEVHARQ
jgi:hypothetical protein